MIVFVTGGTGALGAPAVACLLRAGHVVRALATGDASAAALRAAGAEPVTGSVFDVAEMIDLVRGTDAILHLATRIVPFGSAWRRAAWQANDRLRRDGTRTLVDAALAAGVGTVVYPSFAPVYADGGERWLSYGDPIAPTDILVSTVDAEGEVERFSDAGGRGVVLRLGGVYGPHSAATRDVLRLAARGISGFVGRSQAYQPLVWEGDVATALLASVEIGTVAGGYDVVDDRPLTRAELAATLAGVTGRRAVRRPPAWLVRAAMRERMSFVLRSQRVSNRRFRAATGWTPQISDAAVGLRALRCLEHEPA